MCFDDDQHSFDVARFKSLLVDSSWEWQAVFAGFFSNRTERLIKDLEQLCHEAVVYQLVKGKKISLLPTQHELQETAVVPEIVLTSPAAQSPCKRPLPTTESVSASSCFLRFFARRLEVGSALDNTCEESSIARSSCSG